jgi:hypothetical protein
MARAVKRSVALAIPQPGDPSRVLGVLRPDDPDDELAGVWGLPAATRGPGESDMDALQRLARDKLGVTLTGVRLLSEGRQTRRDYDLEMALYEGWTADSPRLPNADLRPSGRTYYAAWRWASADIFIEASNKGSLCTQLYLSYKSYRYKAR